MAIRVTKQLGFDAAHRLLNHEGKCKHLHGHRYEAFITCESTGLDKVGRVVDFGVIKERVGGFIDSVMDHGYIAEQRDPIALKAVEAGLKVYFLPEGFKGTAEYIAQVIASAAMTLLADIDGLRVVKVVVFETPTSSAEWSV